MIRFDQLRVAEILRVSAACVVTLLCSGQGASQADLLSMNVSVRDPAIDQYDPLWVGIEVVNKSRENIDIFWFRRGHLEIERRVKRKGSSGPEAWTDIKTLQDKWAGTTRIGNWPPNHIRVKAYARARTQSKVVDQRMLAFPGIYRIRFQARVTSPINGKRVASPWVRVEVRMNNANLALIGSPLAEAKLPGKRHYLYVLRNSEGFGMPRPVDAFKILGLPKPKGKSRLVGRMLAPKGSVEWMLSKPFSKVLHEQALVLRAQSLVYDSQMAKGNKRKEILRQADALLVPCGLKKYKCKTGGLGARILWTRAVIASNLGDKVTWEAIGQEISRRYPWARRPSWVNDHRLKD